MRGDLPMDQEILVLNVRRPHDPEWEDPIRFGGKVTALVPHNDMLFIAYSNFREYDRDLHSSKFGIIAFNTSTRRQIPLVDNVPGFVYALSVDKNKLYVGTDNAVNIYELNPWLLNYSI